MNKWIKLSDRAPREGQEILYVVEGLDHDKPFIVKGERNHVTNEGWYWCDVDGIMTEIGNDGEHSFARYWMPMPKLPRIRKAKGTQPK